MRVGELETGDNFVDPGYALFLGRVARHTAFGGKHEGFADSHCGDVCLEESLFS